MKTREWFGITLDRLFFGSFLALVFLLPFKFGLPLLEQEHFLFPYYIFDWFFLPYWPVEFYVLATLFVFVLWCLKNILSAQFEIYWNSSFLFLLLFFVMLVFSTLLSVYPYQSKVLLQQITGYGILFFLSVQIFGQKPQRLLPAVTVFTLSAVLIALYGLHQHFGGLEETLEWLREGGAAGEQIHHNVLSRLKGNRAFGTFIYPNSLAGFLLLSLPVSIVVWFSLWRTRKTAAVLFYLFSGLIVLMFLSVIPGLPVSTWIGAIAGLLLLPAALLLSLGVTFSKGGLLAGAVTLLLFACWFLFRRGTPAKTSQKRIVASGLAAVTALAAVFFLYYQDFWLHRIEMSTFSNRLDYWAAALRIGAEYPFLGSGPGTFAALYPAYKNFGAQDAQHVHNDYLQIFSETGLIAFVFFVSLIGWLLIQSIRFLSTKRDFPSFTFLTALFWGLFALFLHEAGDFDFYIPGIAALQWIFLGILSTVVLKNRHKSVPLPSFAARSVLLCGIFLIAFFSFKPVSQQIRAKYAYDVAKRNYQAGDAEGALKWIERSVRLEPGNAVFYLLRGNIYRRSGNDQEALAQYRQASEIHPEWGPPYILMSRVLKRMWEQEEEQTVFDELVTVWRKSIEKNPTEVPSRVQFARFLEKNGFLEEALIEYLAVLAWEPENAEIRKKAKEIGETLSRYFKDQAQLKSTHFQTKS